MKKMHFELEFAEELLGTASADPEIHSRFIASKAEDGEDGERNARSRDARMAEEIAAIGVDGVQERATTVFPRMPDGTPFIWDYQVKGFFKDACSMLRRADGMKSAKLKAYKKEIDGLVFVCQRRIPLRLPEGAEVGRRERPLRASTPQGERIALASSESVPEGTTCSFDVVVMRDELAGYVREWMDYGSLRGLGQWRNSGTGRFEYAMREVR